MLTAKTSHSSGERKLGQTWLYQGMGKRNQAIHWRPMWMPGKSPAQMTAKMVMASAERFTAVRHFCLKMQRMALMSVPAWPMPIQKTKLVMSHAQETVLFRPQTPMPVMTR